MNVDFGRLHVNNVAIHEVPDPRQGGDGPVLTTTACELTADMRNYFGERIRTSLGSRGHDIAPESGGGSSVPSLVQDYLANKADLVPASQQLAGILYTAQTGVNNPGLLAMIDLTLEGGHAVAILKLEKEKGMRGQLAEQQGGGLAFEVEIVPGIFFTDKTRVFKVAVFRMENGQVVGKASDNQTTSSNIEIAKFFLRTFLGCNYAVAPDTATRAFFDATEDFINERVAADAGVKTRYEMALLSELNSQRKEITPQLFADEHLDVDHRAAFIEHLQASGVRQNTITKDTQLVRNHLHRIQYKFAGGASVFVPPDAVDQGAVNIDALDDGRTRLEIVDTLSSVLGRR